MGVIALPRSSAAPLGATLYAEGVNFSLYSRSAHGVDLLLFDHEDDPHPSRVIPINPVTDRSYHYWHAWVPHVGAGQIYGYQVYGEGRDSHRVLLDPYGRGVAVPAGYDRKRHDVAGAMKSIVIDAGGYDWEGDDHPRHPSSRTIIYEMHVRGFTRHPSSGVADSRRGTYAGLIEKIPYLKTLGITAVELLPVFQFDAQDCPPGLVNYWGYQPVSFFAPHRAYSSRQDAHGPTHEFRDMVKALHRAGIEVILDVVFNHTSEGGHDGPTFCFRGIDNATYYIMDGGRYADYSGCGNSLNGNHPVVRRLIVDSLRWWVQEMHVDGFRFDLASILSRDEQGVPMPNPPVLWDIESDPVLSGTKLIAEAWDAAGLYQVGSFVGDAWKEWNGRFRDDVRSFLRGNDGCVGRMADRITGSPDIYAHEEREPEQSVNFVTCHDGFTLNDLVSYNEKHNEANGESNRDGANDNCSWNCGVEGPTTDSSIDALRNRQIKNFLTVTLLSLGVPMLLMGDEMRHTQNGNNNNYCHDDASNWLDWGLLERHADIHRFVSLVARRRVRRDLGPEQRRLSLSQFLVEAPLSWHGIALHAPDWRDISHTLAVTLEDTADRLAFHWMINAWWEPLEFDLPAHDWQRWIDTGRDSPEDVVPWEEAPRVTADRYRLEPRSMAVLIARLG